jgi:hypothetical protein
MKRLTVFAAFIYMVGTGWALAQNKPVSTSGLPLAKPTLIQGSLKASGAHSPALNSNVHSVNLVLRQQMRQIPKDLKAGKITKAQAQTAMENLKNIRKQELEFFKQNNQREITPDQKSQLTAILNRNAGSI